MSSKTKIVVLRAKELIYTGIFVILGILFLVLIIMLFFPKDKKKNTEQSTPNSTELSYIPGVYTSSLVLSDHHIDMEVIVDDSYISSIRLVNLDEAITTMYPLIQPAFDSLQTQIIETQSWDGITYSDDSRYTTQVLLGAFEAAINKAILTYEIE